MKYPVFILDISQIHKYTPFLTKWYKFLSFEKLFSTKYTILIEAVLVLVYGQLNAYRIYKKNKVVG